MEVNPKQSEYASNAIFHLTTDDLRKWCIEYDIMHDCYPENCYEGMSVYQWILETKLGGLFDKLIYDKEMEFHPLEIKRKIEQQKSVEEWKAKEKKVAEEIRLKEIAMLDEEQKELNEKRKKLEVSHP